MSDWREQTSLLLLLGANLLPVVGALFFGWDARDALLIYWSENLVIGFFAVLRIATASGACAAKLVAMPFFILHFGFFTLIHGFFVVLLTLGWQAGMDSALGPWAALDLVMGLAPWAVVVLFISHGYSFFVNYYTGGERAGSSIQHEMARPYRRIVVMHVAILASFFLLMTARPLLADSAAGRAVPLLVLVGVKLAVDAKLHLNSHGIRLRDLRSA